MFARSWIFFGCSSVVRCGQEEAIPGINGSQTLDRDGSLAQLDAGAVSPESGEGLEGVADRAAQPEVAGLGDDQDVPAIDADLDRTNAIAERHPDLSLDPTPGGDVGVFLGLAVGPGSLSIARRAPGLVTRR